MILIRGIRTNEKLILSSLTIWTSDSVQSLLMAPILPILGYIPTSGSDKAKIMRSLGH